MTITPGKLWKHRAVTATTAATSAPPPEPTAEQAAATMRSKRFVVLLVIVAIVGIIVSLATWCFLELIYQIQQELWTHLPHALGYHNGPPLWWGLPVPGGGRPARRAGDHAAAG